MQTVAEVNACLKCNMLDDGICNSSMFSLQNQHAPLPISRSVTNLHNPLIFSFLFLIYL